MGLHIYWTSYRKRPLMVDSCKRPPPVRDHSVFAFWVLAYGRFDCIPMVKTIGSFRYHNGDDGESVT